MMSSHHRCPSSPCNSTTHLLHEKRIEKDYAASFGVLADTYGFGAPHGASCAPPPSPVNTFHHRPSPSSSEPSSSTSSAEPRLSLYARLFASVLRKSADDSDSCTPTRRSSLTRRLRRSAPNLRSLTFHTAACTSRESRGNNDDDGDGDEGEEIKVRRAREYEAAFAALQAEHGFIIGA